MQELSLEEVNEVNGGIAWIPVIAVVVIVGAVGVGIYNGYQDAKAEAEKKK